MSLPSSTSMRLVRIEWLDSLGANPRWQELELEKTPKPALCHSVGYLLHDSEQCKVIVPHIIQETDTIMGQGCGEMTIPTCAIQEMVDLTPHSTRS